MNKHIRLLGKSGDGRIEFYEVNQEVYRVGAGWVPDVWEIPMGMRWECNINQWNRFRDTVYSWVVEVK